MIAMLVGDQDDIGFRESRIIGVFGDRIYLYRMIVVRKHQAAEKNSTEIIANENSQKKLGKGKVLKNGDTDTSISYMKIEAVPAYNTTPGRDKYHPRHRDNGYILTFDGLRVYIAGDTENIPEMKDLKDIDIAFLPINQPYTMTVPQAAKAARMFSPKILYPYHYGDTKIGELKDALKGSGIDVRIRELQ